MRAASWLLNRFGVDQALIGDLIEEHRTGRTAPWLWRQTLVAVVKTVTINARHHYWLGLRAMVIGWTIHALVVRGRRPAMLLMSSWSWKVDLWLRRTLSIYLPTSFMLVEALGAVLIGWTIARLHRPYEFSMVSLFVASLLVFDAAGFVNSFQRGLSTMGPLGLAINSVFPFLIVPIAIFCGACLPDGSHSHAGEMP